MMKKNYYQKAASLGMLLVILLVFQKYTSKENENFSNIKFISENTFIPNLSEFDPNDLDEKQWKNLGFSEKQTATILNYKQIVGGQFTSKEQLKKCYAISENKFAELNPYILLPESKKETQTGHFKSPGKKSITISKKFNPDLFLLDDWINLGFSEKQAEAILKYKTYLGGSFISKEKFKECFIVSDENYRKLASYLILPDKAPENPKNFDKKTKNSNIKYHFFDPNILDLKDWQSLGFSQRQAEVIINYRDRNLKGSFKNLEDVQKCFVISSEKFEELKPYIKIDYSKINKNVQIITNQERTDFSKTDLNAITFKQLLEFGLDEKSAGFIIGFRKKLGGFANKEQILDTYNIDKDLVQKLISVCPLNSSVVQKYTLVDAPEEWLKNHPYFKYSADKIIFYRVSNPDDRKIWKFLKLKPEYEARMRLYLK